jgi:hypothetical protein
MFIKLARILAILALVMGVCHVLLGFAVAEGFISPGALARYTTSSSTGALIDRGIYTLLIAVAFGALVEIKQAIDKI